MALGFAILVIVAAAGVYAEEPEKLVRGVNARITEFPHMVSIRRNGIHHCGGAIVRGDLILTAAHCVDPLIQDKTSDVTIVVGTDSLVNGGVAYRPSYYWIHNKYSSQVDWDYDIGAIQLTASIPNTPTTRPIPISQGGAPPPAGSVVTVSAWGATAANQPTYVQLQKLDLGVVSNQECQRYHTQRIWNMHICTYRAIGVGTCAGDSGSPLVYKGQLVGVVSGGIPCAGGVPDIFTNLDAVRDFLQTVFSARAP